MKPNAVTTALLAVTTGFEPVTFGETDHYATAASRHRIDERKYRRESPASIGSIQASNKIACVLRTAADLTKPNTKWCKFVR